MKSKIVAIVFVALTLLSRSSTVVAAQEGRFTVEKTNEECLLIVTDTSTGCMYLVFREYKGSSKGGMGWGGMCQLTNFDGKPLLK